MKIFWDDESVAILRRHYSSGGAEEVNTHLRVKKTISAIRAKAYRLDIKCNPENKKCQKWNDFMDSQVVDAFSSSKKGAIKKLSEKLGVTIPAIRYRAAKLNCYHSCKRMNQWTEKEDSILMESADKGISCIQIRLKRNGFTRTRIAIAKRLRIIECDRFNPDVYSSSRLAQCFGVSINTVLRWIKDKKLKAKRANGQYTEDPTDTPRLWLIKQHDVKTFIRNNPLAIDLRKVDRIWFIETVIGPPIIGGS